MKKFKILKILLACFCITFVCIGCSNKKQDKETDLPATTTEEVDTDIDIVNECESLTPDKANAIVKEIREIMIDTQQVANRLENFSMKFENEKKEDGKIIIDITVEADWTTIRKPEDNPIIIGMNQVVEELKTEEEKEKAKVIISGFLAEMEPDYNKTERLPEYLKVRFENEEDSNYELLYPEVLDGKTTLYPMKEYYEENFKENREERIQLGRETLLINLE